MNNVLAALFVGFVVLIVVFVGVGGSFDRHFWLSALPGLMENLAILAVAVIVIDRIFKTERSCKLEQTNAEQSKMVFFLANKLAFLLLQDLALLGDDAIPKHSELDFAFALEEIKRTNLAAVFYEKLMESHDKEAFLNGFAEILKPHTEGISKALDKIYPRPDPTLMQMAERQMNFAIGAIDSLKFLVEAVKRTNAELGNDQQFTPEHLDLLIKISYHGLMSKAVQDIKNAIIHLADKANANELFFSLD